MYVFPRLGAISFRLRWDAVENGFGVGEGQRAVFSWMVLSVEGNQHLLLALVLLGFEIGWEV